MIDCLQREWDDRARRYRESHDRLMSLIATAEARRMELLTLEAAVALADQFGERGWSTVPQLVLHTYAFPGKKAPWVAFEESPTSRP